MTMLSKILVASVLTTLTIGPASWAQSKLRPRVASAKTNAQGTTESDYLQVAPKSRALVGPSESALFLAPNGGEFLFESSLGVNRSESKVTNDTDIAGVTYKRTYTNTTNTAELLARYGFNDYFFMGARLTYGTEEGESKYTIVSGNATATDGKSSSSGLAEPTLYAGFQNGTSNFRFIGMLSADIPTGNSKTETKDGKSTADRKAGGADLTPQLLFINNVGFAKIISGLSYSIAGEKTTEYSTASGTSTTKTTGGNSTTIHAGMEFPRALNTGFLAGYSTSDSRKSKSSNSERTDNSDGSKAVLVAGYMGIPVSDQALLQPQVGYIKILDTELNGYKIDNSDAVNLGLRIKVGF